jgi:hypothetical protein
VKRIKIYADFNNADRSGRLRLTCAGTTEALFGHQIVLREGMPLILTNDEGLESEGIVTYSDEERIWTARIDWTKLKTEP